MSPEWLSAIAGAGTFVVIAASALAALVQLRHMRSSNQIAALTDMRKTIESQEFQAAFAFLLDELPERLKEPAVRNSFSTSKWLPPGFGPVRLIANFFANIGLLVRTGVIDRQLACYLWHDHVLRSWEAIAPVAVNIRALRNDDMWQNFEYFAVLSKQWIASHPQGLYPRGAARMAAPELWPETKDALRVT